MTFSAPWIISKIQITWLCSRLKNFLFVVSSYNKNMEKLSSQELLRLFLIILLKDSFTKIFSSW